jgi:ribonuclease HI
LTSELIMSQSLLGPDTLSDTIPPQVDVYTDGGCDPNPGPGGWGAIIHWDNREWTLSGNDPDTTNNRMELHAAAAALALLEGILGHCQVSLHTDSQYLRQGITEWIDGWVGRGWRTSDKQPVKNQDLWRVLHRLAQAHDVTWHWLKGHAGHPLNERADNLATEALRALQRKQGEPDAHQPGDDGRSGVEICVKVSCRGAQGQGGWGAVLRSLAVAPRGKADGALCCVWVSTSSLSAAASRRRRPTPCSSGARPRRCGH